MDLKESIKASGECPKCKQRFSVSVAELERSKTITCPHCGAVGEVTGDDPAKAASSLDHLQSVIDSFKNLK